jgi:hypothetical protein
MTTTMNTFMMPAGGASAFPVSSTPATTATNPVTGLPSVQGPPMAPGTSNPLAPTISPTAPVTTQPNEFGMLGSLGLWGEGGLNWENTSQLAKGVGSLASLWGAFQQNKIAQEQLDLQRETFDTNMDFQVQSYNTSLEDRIRARYQTEGRGQGAQRRYLNQHKLSRD